MKLIQPIIIKEIDKGITLPVCIFKSTDGVSSYIDKFTVEEKEKCFNIKIDQIDPNRTGVIFRELGYGYNFVVSRFVNHIITPYKIIISKESDNHKGLPVDEDRLRHLKLLVIFTVGLSFSASKGFAGPHGPWTGHFGIGYQIVTNRRCLAHDPTPPLHPDRTRGHR